MTSYQCSYCQLTFSNPTSLTRHISKKHAYTVESGETSKTTYEEEPGLWDDDDYLPTEEANLWDDDNDLPIEDPMVRLR